MQNKTREELKSIYVTGARPTQADFAALLDNYVHKADIVSDAANKTGHYYVSRSYTGIGNAAVVAVNQFPTSPNASYNAQLQMAQRGNPHTPYPDPYAARAAAMQDLANGMVQQAFIIVNAGDRWTVGSDDPSFNGDSQGNALNPETADIQFAAAHANTDASLLQDKLVVYFGQDAGFDYINVKYPVFLGYVTNPGSTAATKMAIEGKGKMLQVYGQKQGFSAYLIGVNDPNVSVSLSFGTLYMNQYHSFSFDNVAYNRMDIDSVYCYEANFAQAYSNVQSAIYNEQVHDINIRTIIFGNRFSWFPMAGAMNDFWYLFSITKAKVPTTVNINLGTVIIDGLGNTPLLRTTAITNTATNLMVNLNVDVLKHTFYGSTAGTLMITGFATGCQNKQVTARIKNGYSEQGLVIAYGAFYGAGSNNSFVRVHSDNMIVKLVNPGASPYAVINEPTIFAEPHTNCYTAISGNYSLVNCGAYTNATTGVANGTLVLFENASLTMDDANTLPVFNIGEPNGKWLALKNVTVKCANTKLFANTSGGTPSVYIQNVATTDTAINNTVTYEGEPIKTIPPGYF
jgi:hypothetical protein